MLIILILFILAVILIAAGFIIRRFYAWCDFDIPCFAVGIIVFCGVIFVNIGCIDSYVCKDLTEEQYLMKYEILQEQLTNEFYKTEILDQRQELMDDILEYNSDVVNGRFKSKTLWFNWFYPEDWDSIPLIEFPKEGEKE